jgi:hypothetical protein
VLCTSVVLKPSPLAPSEFTIILLFAILGFEHREEMAKEKALERFYLTATERTHPSHT